MLRHFLSLGFGLSLFAPGLLAQGLDNAGSEFLLGYNPNTAAGTPDIELHLTSSTATTVTVEYPVNAPTFSNTFSVVPGAITIVSLPSQASTNWSPNTVGNNLVRAFADDEFVAYTINRRQFTSDAGLALPVDTMNTEYIQVDYAASFSNPSWGSQMLVYAAFDNTTVTVTPAVNMVGHSAGVPFNVSLNAGEAYFGKSDGIGPGLTGTLISADRPVGLVNGNYCTNVPVGVSFCDHIFEVAQPVQTWGEDVLVVNLPQRPGGSVYRVVASRDGTDVEQNGVVLASLNAGEFVEVGPVAGNHRFTANEPIFVCQYMTGSTSPGAQQGDPAQGNMIPSEQFLPNYTFSTVGGAQFATHYLTIIAADADVGSLTLDGSPVAASAFTSISGSGFSAAVLSLPEGTHGTASTSGHGIYVSGYNNDDSYLYPGGARFEFINPVGDENPPICDVVVAQDGLSATGTLRDDRPSEDTNMNGVLDPGEDLNGNGLIDEDTGIFFASLDPGATNLTVQVAPFTPGDSSVTFTADLAAPGMPGIGVLRVTDGAGNVTLCDLNLGSSFNAYCFGTACPCNNDDPNAGCSNSTGVGALLDATGTASIAADDLVLTATEMPANRFAVVYYGANPACGAFGDGLRAVAPGQFFRAPNSNSGSTGSISEGPGLAASEGFMAGETVHFQVFYRDNAGPCGNFFNLTNGLSVSFAP